MHRWLRFWRRENFHRIVATLVALLLLGALGLWQLDPAGRPFLDWLWWSVVTMTTVGYGDITPTTIPGRLIGVVLMFCGIGILSMITATIASFLVERQLTRERGMGTTQFKDHIILCSWNVRTREILRELRSDPRTERSPIVLVAEVDRKPVDDDDLHFVRGPISEETLARAGIADANTVVILADDRLEAGARDAQTVLATLTVESLNPAAYTIVEVLDEANVRHCQRARADEVIVGHQLSSRLIASAALDHGLSKVVSELLSQRFGQTLCQVPLPAELVGRSFLEVLVEMKTANKAIVVGVQRDDEVVTNPDADYRLEARDQLIAIVVDQPAAA